MINKYEKVDPSPDIIYIVESMNIDSITQINPNGTKREDMPMKNVSQLDYNTIIEYKDYLQNTGTCVIDNFISIYGEALGIIRKYQTV